MVQWCIQIKSGYNFKFLGSKGQIIVGKSGINKDIFDTIVFADREITKVFIPNYIKYIEQSAFENCLKLKTIEISDDSQIESIGKDSFSSTALINFKVPKKITSYKNRFLYNNCNISCFEFLGDSFVDNDTSSLFNELINTKIVSFPNVRKLTISLHKLHDKSRGFMLFVSTSTEIIIDTNEINNNIYENSDSTSISDSDSTSISDGDSTSISDSDEKDLFLFL